MVDPGRLGAVAVEIRDTDGFVVMSFEERLDGATVRFGALRDGRYDV